METTDIGLATYVYSLGKEVEIERVDHRQYIFKFEDCPEVKEWQSEQAIVNGLAFLNCYKTLIRKVKGNGTRTEQGR